ncbi:hypothetical protein H0H92_014142 [Tricholoma furcatifolium]|nr:hypothetical protein H0H92_014142 [Tricholoma furcatifolium]
MGTDSWGGVMRKPASDETLNDAISRAYSVTSTSTTASETLSLSVVPSSATPSTSTSSISASSFPPVVTPSTSSSTASSLFSTSTTLSVVSTSAPPATKTSSISSTLSSVQSTTKAQSTLIAAQNSAVASAPSTSSSGTSSSDINAYLTAHNTVRAEHGAAPLTWSDDLASKAQSWANNCVFEHSGGSLGPYGENLAAGTGSSYDIQAAIQSWTDEVSEYDPSNPVASHFTQVVWKSTTQVGCAVQSCSGIFPASYGLAKFYVCEYSPQGNIIGEFATLSNASYIFLVLVTIVATGLSCAALLAQAVRTSPKQTWFDNINALVIGASYVIVLLASLLYCGKRRIAMRLRLQKISKANKTLSHSDMPEVVHQYVAQEYVRACLVSYESLPKDAYHEGWGRPGTQYSGIRFRRTLLDTIPEIDELAHVVIPTHPAPKPHARMLHHFRFIVPLLPVDEDGLTPLHYYDAAIQLARNGGNGALGEQEFEVGLKAAEDILKWYACWPSRG